MFELKLRDTEMFKEILSIVKGFTNDERISSAIRKDYIDMLINIMAKYKDDENG